MTVPNVIYADDCGDWYDENDYPHMASYTRTDLIPAMLEAARIEWAIAMQDAALSCVDGYEPGYVSEAIRAIDPADVGK